jgi:hypothetical protein
MDGYGNDTTATTDGTAAAIAQIFSTGVTAYVDSQAIQRGYQINNPQYFQSGYPAGTASGYQPTPAGASIQASASSNSTLIIIVIAVAALFLLKR